MTSYTDADICGLALGRLGVDKTVSSLATEQTKEASLCRRFYALCRDEVLSRAPWPFAIKIQALAPLADADLLPGWGYQYDLPSDCLSLIEVVADSEVGEADNYYCACSQPWMPPRQKQGFRKALSSDGSTQVVLANIDDAWAVYVRRVTNVAAYPVMLVSLIADRLAMELAMPLTVDPRYYNVCRQRYESAFLEAASREFEQEAPVAPVMPAAIQARN